MFKGMYRENFQENSIYNLHSRLLPMFAILKMYGKGLFQELLRIIIILKFFFSIIRTREYRDIS